MLPLTVKLKTLSGALDRPVVPAVRTTRRRPVTSEPTTRTDRLRPVEVRQQADGVVVIRCEGALDFPSCAELRGAIAWSLMRPGLAGLRVDVTGVSVPDAAGIRCLADCHKRCTAVGLDFELVASPAVERLLDLVHFGAATQGASERPGHPVRALSGGGHP
jgi:anti-anti-sigma factor